MLSWIGIGILKICESQERGMDRVGSVSVCACEYVKNYLLAYMGMYI